MKKLLFIFILGAFITIIIYYRTNNKKIDIMVIGDSVASGETTYGNLGISFNMYLKEYYKTNNLDSYNTDYSYINNSVTEVITKINENTEKNQKPIQRVIKEAEIIIIALGEDELSILNEKNLLNNLERRDYIANYEELLKEIRHISQNKIIVVSLFGNLNQLNWLNKKIKNIAINNDCNYLDIQNIIKKEHYFDNKDNHLNHYGQKVIFNEIKKELSL